MEGIVDRIEKDRVVLEVGDEIITMKKNKFPDNLKEGDLVKCVEGEFIILEEETRKRNRKMNDLLDSLFDD